MKQSKILHLLIILIVLIAVAWLSGTFDSAPSTINVPEVALDASSIDHIEAVQPEVTVVLEDKDGTWELVAPVAALADSIAVSTLLRNLGELDIESVVSSNPERYANYGVDTTGTRLIVSSGSGTQRFVVSGEGADFSSVYLRLDGDPRVFSAVPRISIPTNLDRWRDKRVFSVSSQAVLKATVSTPDHSYSISKDATGWLLDSSGVESYADSASVARWLRNFSPLRADGFLDSTGEGSDPTHNLTLRLSNGSSFLLSMKKRESDVAATYSGEPGTIYKLFSSRLNSLFPDPSTLQPKQ